MEDVTALLPEGKYFEAVNEVIERCSKEMGMQSARVASEFSKEKQRLAIVEQIRKAGMVIADISGRNPHVLYEVGIAHALGRKVVLLANHGEDFPFDRSSHRTIIYAGNLDLLRQELLLVFRGEEGSPGEKGGGGKTARDKFEELFGSILKAHHHSHKGKVEMENETTFVLLNQDMELALVQDLARKARELGMRIKLM